MIYKVLTKTMFKDEFTRMGRGNQFSYEGLNALYDYYDELGAGESYPNTGYELDVIAICCGWTEYDTEDEAFKELGIDGPEQLEDNYFTIYLDNGGVLVQN
jgi:hypothetical protein